MGVAYVVFRRNRVLNRRREGKNEWKPAVATFLEGFYKYDAGDRTNNDGWSAMIIHVYKVVGSALGKGILPRREFTLVPTGHF